MNPWLFRAMAIFRFLAVTILSFLLLSPLFKKSSEIVEKPLILFAQDNSLSIAITKDSLYYKNEYPAALDRFIVPRFSKQEMLKDLWRCGIHHGTLFPDLDGQAMFIEWMTTKLAEQSNLPP